MSEAFPLVKGATCVMRENGKTLPLREAVIGDVSGELYADVGPLLLRLIHKTDGSYGDSQGRTWDVNGIEICPICSDPFKPDDLCATDIELLTVHAECLDGCEVVDLETEEPTDKPLTTYRYSEVMEPDAPHQPKPQEQTDWIKHDGKTMPVNGSVRVEVRMASGFEHEEDFAQNWLKRDGSRSNWHHDLGTPHPCDIVEYRIVAGMTVPPQTRAERSALADQEGGTVDNRPVDTGESGDR